MDQRPLRAILGFFISPAVPALLLYLWQMSHLFTGYPLLAYDPILKIIDVVLLLTGYLTAGFIGIPAYIVMQRWQVRNILIYLAVSGVIGLAPGMLLSVIWGLSNSEALSSIGGLYGLIAGGIFWLIAIKGSRISTVT
jgi:hypothetical protein